MTNFFESIDTVIEAPKREVTAVMLDRPAGFAEVCSACKGSGVFRGYSGRTVGNCFKCKGAGKKVFKTSSEARAKVAIAKVEKKVASIEAFKAANPEVFAWMVANQFSFDFAGSLMNALCQYGDLTDGQLAAVNKCIAKATAKKAERAVQVENAPAIDVSKIETAFAAAKGNKIKSPKLNLGSFKFSCAPASGKNAGSIYVKSGEQYVGKVTGGKFYGSYACTPEQESEVLAVASNPAEAAKAYGFRSGNCSCCGRTLTVGKSIDLGIGPICFEKYGWT